jgi:8-oxo-dGTP pyrophosphatase MutT (NUDIX family)
MCVHLCPGFGPGVVDALGAALAGVDDSVVDEVVDDACDARAPDAELVEALAIVSPNASVAPSMAAPAAVPMRGLVILTRFSLLCWPGGSDPRNPSRPTAPDRLLRGPSHPALNQPPGRCQDERVTLKHLTSSVFVFRRIGPGWRLGLIRHPRFDRMMIPGGHVEEEESQAEAALREVAEETGLAVRLVSPPAAPMPGAYRPPRVAPPWWIVEYEVPADNHLGAAHIHIDNLYVALADGEDPVGEPAHPFGWYAAADLSGLNMFEDARILALALLSGLSEHAGGAGDPGSGGVGDPGYGAPAQQAAEPGPTLSAALLARLEKP